MHATFAEIYDAHQMQSYTLREISDNNTLRALCPGWWKPEGRKLSAEECAKRAREFDPCAAYAEVYASLVNDGRGHINSDEEKRAKSREYDATRRPTRVMTEEQRARKRERDRKSKERYRASMTREEYRELQRKWDAERPAKAASVDLDEKVTT